MFGPPEVHIFRRKGKGAGRWVVDFTGGSSAIGLLILRLCRSTREEDRAVREKIGPKSFPLQVKVSGGGENLRHRIV